MHRSLDVIWRVDTYSFSQRRERRTKIYAWISLQLGIQEYHTGHADAAQCRRVLELVCLTPPGTLEAVMGFVSKKPNEPRPPTKRDRLSPERGRQRMEAHKKPKHRLRQEYDDN